MTAWDTVSMSHRASSGSGTSVRNLLRASSMGASSGSHFRAGRDGSSSVSAWCSFGFTACAAKPSVTSVRMRSSSVLNFRVASTSRAAARCSFTCRRDTSATSASLPGKN
ncbi:hypothetical protein D7X99_21380 [Corallococcus sp. AB032C]|nr:hypothetical protein D7X99_21380 [Corallococcus sp. AB032C]